MAPHPLALGVSLLFPGLFSFTQRKTAAGVVLNRSSLRLPIAVTFYLCRQGALQPNPRRPGWDLLKSNLTREQVNQLHRTRAFDVIGGATGRRYRIRQGLIFNVDLLSEQGWRVLSFCIRPRGDLPMGDIMLRPAAPAPTMARRSKQCLEKTEPQQ